MTVYTRKPRAHCYYSNILNSFFDSTLSRSASFYTLCTLFMVQLDEAKNVENNAYEFHS